MKSRRPAALSRRESQLMEVLWDAGGATAGEVRKRLDDGSAESTVRTLLKILVDKGLVRRSGRSHAYRYSAAVRRDRLARPALALLIERFFGGSGRALVVRMLETADLSPDELERIAREFRRRS